VQSRDRKKGEKSCWREQKARVPVGMKGVRNVKPFIDSWENPNQGQSKREGRILFRNGTHIKARGTRERGGVEGMA